MADNEKPVSRYSSDIVKVALETWTNWIKQKNNLLKSRGVGSVKLDPLEMSNKELKLLLSYFVQDVKPPMPNRGKFYPSTIYYFVLGIQEYLNQHSKSINLFTDPQFAKLNKSLDNLNVSKCSIIKTGSKDFVSLTRVREKHLRNCGLLGVQSPHALLNTLMFYNMKFLGLDTVEKHKQFDFSYDIRETYKQYENAKNKLVEMHDFYLSKWPLVERNSNSFYLEPDLTCTPDSPVWFTEKAVSEDDLTRMFRRLSMISDLRYSSIIELQP